MTAKTSQTQKAKPKTMDLIVSERAFAGSLLQEPDRVLRIAREKGLTADSFTDESARRVFGSVQRIIEAGNPCELLAVQADTGLDALVIEKMIDDCPTAAHAEYHADRVLGAALKRQAHAAVNGADGVEGLRLALQGIMATLGTDSTSAPTVSASAWLTEPDEPEQPIMEGLFDAGDRVAIVGQSKARKSFYALQLAVAVSTGTDFLGVPTVKQRVLLVNGEIAARSYKKRLRRMIEKLGIDPANLTDLLVVNASESADVGGFVEILTLSKEQTATVAIVDPAYLLLGDEIDQQQVKQSIRDMKRFAAEGVTLVTVYHATKGKIGDRQAIDRISGSGIFARDASTMLTLCEHASEPDHVVVQAITRNYAPTEPITVRFEDGAFLVAEGVAPTEKTSSTKPRREYPVEDLRACFSSEATNYGDTLATVRQRLGCGRDRAKDEIGRAVREDIAMTEQDGRQTLYRIRPNVD